MQLIVTLRKEVANEDEANVLFAVVKQKLDDHPEIEIKGQVSQRLVTVPN